MDYTILTSWTGMTFTGPGIKNIKLGYAGDLKDVRRIMESYRGNTFLLFEGGADVQPYLYGQENRKSTCHPARDRFEVYLYHLAVEFGIPMLGICRGHQFLNVMRGGTLYQDLTADYKGQHISGHEVVLTEYTGTNKTFTDLMASAPLARHDDLEKGVVRVNSLHHQGLDRLAPDTAVLATHPDGLVEACRWDTGMSVQWHPEFQRHNEFVSFMFRNYVND